MSRKAHFEVCLACAGILRYVGPDAHWGQAKYWKCLECGLPYYELEKEMNVFLKDACLSVWDERGL